MATAAPHKHPLGRVWEARTCKTALSCGLRPWVSVFRPEPLPASRAERVQSRVTEGRNSGWVRVKGSWGAWYCYPGLEQWGPGVGPPADSGLSSVSTQCPAYRTPRPHPAGSRALRWAPATHSPNGCPARSGHQALGDPLLLSFPSSLPLSPHLRASHSPHPDPLPGCPDHTHCPHPLRLGCKRVP